MPHSAPDWFPLVKETIFPAAIDLGELAVRLKSIDTFDRGGDVIWLDDFEDGLGKWEIGGNGAGTGVALSTARSRNGAQSILLTAGSDGLLTATINHRSAFPVLSVFGFEFSFHVIELITNIILDIAIFDGTNQRQFSIRWVESTNTLEYLDSAGVYQTIASNIFFNRGNTLFHTLKLVFDGLNTEYVRLLQNATTHLLTDIAARTLASAVSPHARITITLTGTSGTNRDMYVDDTIFTQNEPV